MILLLLGVLWIFPRTMREVHSRRHNFVKVSRRKSGEQPSFHWLGAIIGEFFNGTETAKRS